VEYPIPLRQGAMIWTFLSSFCINYSNERDEDMCPWMAINVVLL
jgi:hypothetical protein